MRALLLNKKRDDKRGIIGIIFFFLVMFTILAVGFVLAILVGVINIATDTVLPVLDQINNETLGVGTTYNTAADSALNIVDVTFSSLKWLLVFGYGLALVFSIVFAVSYKQTAHPIFIAVYIGFILLLIFFSIIISNAYEDIHNGNDELAVKLQEQTAMSYLIIYSPAILLLIAFITGLYMFAGTREGMGI